MKIAVIATLGIIAAIAGTIIASSLVFEYLATRIPNHSIKEVSWIPPSAHVQFYADSHGGFHGDGTTLIALTTPPNSLKDLMAYFSRAHGVNWTTNRLDSIAVETVKGSFLNLKAPTDLLPSRDQTYLIGKREPFQGLYYKLIIIETNRNQMWYVDITT
jgi:hypothetical protein